jgi:hypothetical protein
VAAVPDEDVVAMESEGAVVADMVEGAVVVPKDGARLQ